MLSWLKENKSILLNRHFVALLLTLTLILVPGYKYSKFQNWSNKNNPERIFRSDGSGYYAYLPQLFIYQDKNFEFSDSLTNSISDSKTGQFMSYYGTPPKIINKYFIGTAVLQFPFFAVAHILCPDHYSANGYSYPYQLLIAFAALFYLILGCLAGYYLLVIRGLPPWASAFGIISIAIATPLLHYTIIESAFSHVYSFAILSFWLLAVHFWVSTQKRTFLFVNAFLFGLLLLIRPTNAIALLAFFLFFPSLKTAGTFLKSHLFLRIKALFGSLLLVVLPLSLQVLNVYHQTGEIAFNLYQDEGFSNWASPHFWDILFSYNKGLFVYAPICFVSLLSILFLARKSKYKAILATLIFVLFTYITSSWWNWWYGGGIGMRPYLEFSLAFAWGLAYLFSFKNVISRILLITCLVFASFFQYTLIHQFQNGIIQHEQMDSKKYWSIFLKTDKRFQWRYFVEPDPSIEKDDVSFLNTKIGDQTLQDSQIIYPVSIALGNYQLDKTATIKLEAMGRLKIDDSDNIPKMVVEVRKNLEWVEEKAMYNGMQVEDLNKWSRFSNVVEIDLNVKNTDSLRIRFDNQNGQALYKEVKYRFYK